MSTLSALFEQSNYFMPHGHCYLWLPSVLWLHVITDGAIALAYFSIPFALHVFVRRRRDLQFRWIFVMFAAFIFWCGLTHVMSIWVIWHPDYVVEGLIKAVTAAISLATAVLAWQLIPRALALPSPDALRRINEELHQEIARRESAEVELREVNRALQERLAELESFSYTVSHDLRAPLRAIDGFANLLLLDHAGDLREEGRALLGRVSKSARKMSELIDGLLAFVRLSHVALPRGSVDMRQLALDAAGAAQAEYPQVVVQVGPLPAAQGDAATLSEVWSNLVGNACKFSAQKPGGRVAISAERSADDETVYVVRDNGAGFDMRYANNLFRMFHRLHDASRFEGTGIGLAVVKRIVERHGGRVWAEAVMGEGATFRFVLGPAVAAMDEPAADMGGNVSGLAPA
jgi:signal transduction histidine kinase